MDTNTQLLLAWIAPPPLHPKRGKAWYVTTSSLAVFLIVQSVWSGNWLFALLLFGIAGYYLFEERWLPKQSRSVSLTESGVVLDGKETAWSDWRRAWFQQRPGTIELHLERKVGLQRREVLPLPEGIDPQMIIEVLAQRVPLEVNRRETLLDTITHILKI